MKAEANLCDHGISFEESATVFDDPYALEMADMTHTSLTLYVATWLALSSRVALSTFRQWQRR